MLRIREIIDKEEWEDFLLKEKPRTFLQSWNWGEFNLRMGSAIWRLGIFEDSELIGTALVLKVLARRGTFLFVPHGPIFKESRANIEYYEFKTLMYYLKELAQKEKCDFVRVSPLLKDSEEHRKLFKNLGFREAPMHMHAELMWILDVAPAEEKLLKDMRKTTRYLVKKAQTEGVEIIKSSDPAYSDIFNEIYKDTAERQNFIGFSRDYLQNEFESFKDDDQIMYFLANYKGETIAVAMIVFYGDSGFYHQGASNPNSKIPASYLLQWEIIREVKKKGMKYYNFWGISPAFADSASVATSAEGAASAGKPTFAKASADAKALADKPDNRFKKHPWDGLSLFKTGFGGFSEKYLPSQDLILKKSYWLNYLVEKFRKTWRRL